MMQLAPHPSLSAPARRLGVRNILRTEKPLSQRELASLYDRVEKRLLGGGEPFGVFAMRRGRRGRVFLLISVTHSNFAKQLRVHEARRHLVGVYDGRASLVGVWEDLCAFDRPADVPAVGTKQ